MGGRRALPFGHAAIDSRLPAGGLAFGALHEVVPATFTDTAAAVGFLAALLACLPPAGPVVVVVPRRGIADHGRLHGHGFAGLGLDPARLILVETATGEEAHWAMEEALRSAVPAAVAGAADVGATLKLSRRLHLAAEASGLPLLLLRPASAAGSSAAATRWRIAAAPAGRDRFGMIGGWRWQAALERCRNGRPGSWMVEYDHAAHRFSLAAPLADPALSGGRGAAALAHAG
jgi:protein ImuA